MGPASARLRILPQLRKKGAYDASACTCNHINVILAYTGRKQRVTFAPEVADHSQLLCPCDMNRNNFIKDPRSGIVAVNFSASRFLPPSSFAFALREGDHFTQRIASSHIGVLRVCPIRDGHYRGSVSTTCSFFGPLIVNRDAPSDVCLRLTCTLLLAAGTSTPSTACLMSVRSLTYSPG
ncbi:hypothetical protein K438DRAFT_1997897 [Mycena galopus ATCC 62051]|nr:hypothetical protein K438DRAFT_1997897 [Mycena galopus ATCC 62051]